MPTAQVEAELLLRYCQNSFLISFLRYHGGCLQIKFKDP